ncbi:MAG: bifunctional UDP-N-acetylmuramoyl-tripeptide:D-alanyl-D-alanine ligase/alanine racemase [Bacteroidota bacterium]
MKYTASEIAKVVNGNLELNPGLEVTDVLTDSRRTGITEGLAFFALRGINHDGHQFISSLYIKGVRVFVVERLPGDMSSYLDASFIQTGNTLEALQLLAAHHRKSFTSKVIAVTGSAGKTIVKEWLSDVLGLSAPVIRSPKSYNSQIGVPLSVLRLDNKYTLGIFEAGISMTGEMDNLRKVIGPDIGVITNIGDAHSENFADMSAKAAEKLKLFTDASLIVYCSDHKEIRKILLNDKSFRGKKIIDWSFENINASIIVRKNSDAGTTRIEMSYLGNIHNFIIPFIDRASVENAITVASVCLALDTDTAIIRKGLEGLLPVAMRMEIKNGINGSLLVEDYYNSDPGSLGIAIEYLRGQGSRLATLILSDFIQSGRDEKELYGSVEDLVKKNGIHKFIGIGPALSRNRQLFRLESEFYNSTDEFIQRFNPARFHNEVILLKGARMFEFERIGKLLEQKVHQTLLEVNLDAIAHNLNEFRRFLDPDTRIMAMVKAFAYGAGPAEIAGLLEFHRVSYLGVAYADEGIELRNAGVTLPVMVMNPDSSSSEQMIRYDLEPVIYSFASLDQFSGVASRHGLFGYPVHIKIDSGMHRLGFMPDDINTLAVKLNSQESLKIVSVFSHFSASEDPRFDDFTHRQAEMFLKAAEKICAAADHFVLKHICNSAGIVRFPRYQLDMVRPGIGIYGVGKFEGLNLKPAGRFRTSISQIKRIPAGEPVGYGCADVSVMERSIAILPVGYADGLNRKLGNGNGSLFIRNVRAPVIGNICMDMCMADVTGLEAGEGDEAEIFGSNIPIEEMAEKCDTIPYEILTSIPGRVKRVFLRE